jgi:hypothetical protein
VRRLIRREGTHFVYQAMGLVWLAAWWYVVFRSLIKRNSNPSAASSQ